MNRISTGVLAGVLSTSLATVFADQALANAPAAETRLAPMPVHVTTTQNIVDALASRHYVQAVLDDNLSSKIYDTYISDLDPSKSYFLASDIAEFEKYLSLIHI